jgi:hypothetical protein
MNNIIENIINEAAIDPRIEDGIVNLKNPIHVQVIAENMFDAGIDETVVNEFVDEFMEEGKYPDRQAYNKEGWLVTFPSKEYRDRAIKKGTHSISDPTHGKGGMNLYYKRKGKQQRQTHQDTTATDTEPNQQQTKAPAPQAPQAQQAAPAQATPATNSKERAPGEVTPEMLGDAPDSSDSEKQASPAASGGDGSALPPSDGGKETAPSDGSAPAPAAAPQAPAAPTPPPPPPFVELSKKFAAQKGWVGTPYGEWRDRSGTAMAVEALSGEVVPIKTNDREELKLFVEKNK